MARSNSAQLLFKSVLLLQTVALVVYTAFAVKHEGWNLFSIFTDNLKALSWNGQFNLDFSCYLLLSGIWILWRHKFSPSSFLIAVVAAVVGFIAFAPYVLYLLAQEKGDMKKVLVGER